MADTVRYYMEEMVPELEDLEERGYFQKQEIKQVVKKRTHFEYLLKRPAPKKADYLRYAEYEAKLEELRAHRKQIMGIKGQTTLGDYAIVRRIHLIYERASRKFRGDLRIWLKWLHFCRTSNSNRQTSRVLTKALQLHPTASGLWSYAAAWEFEHNSNAAAARTLMQRGLRMCRSSQQLWLEYFRMELMYAHKLGARRRLLGIDAPGSKSSISASAEAVSNATEEATQEGTAQEDSSAAAVQAVLSGAVAKVVYKSAIAAIPDSLSFRQGFLELLGQFKLDGVPAIRQAVLDSIHRDFGDKEECWEVQARAAAAAPHLSAAEALREGQAVFERGLEAKGTSRMFDLYATWLRECLAEQSNAAEQDRELHVSIQQKLLELCQRAYAAGAAGEELLLSWPEWAVEAGQMETALQAAASSCEALPACIPAWQQRLALQAHQAAVQVSQSGEGASEARQAAAGQVEGLALQALQAVPTAEAAELWTAAYEKAAALGSKCRRLNHSLLRHLTATPKGPLRGGMGSVAGAAVEVAWRLQSLTAARQLCDDLLRIPSPGGSFFQDVIALEQAVTTPASTEDVKRIRRLCEAGLTAHGAQDHELWLQYAAFEQKHGRGAGQIYWRAIKALDSPEEFVAAYSQKGHQTASNEILD